MAPRRSAKVASVVVGISRPREPVIRHVIPFFARDFASFAANANGRVSEEADLHIFLHVIVAALVRALRAFADHKNRNWENRNAGIEQRNQEPNRAVSTFSCFLAFLICSFLILFLLSHDRRRLRLH